MKILHLFHNYLHQTQNWSFNTLVELPDTQVFVGANRFLKTNFYSERFTFIEFPLKEAEFVTESLGFRLFNLIVRSLHKRFYPPYLTRVTGRIDIVHSHFAPTGWAFKDIPKQLNAPHVISFYGWDYERLPHIKPVWINRYEALFQESDFFLCEGSHGARLLTRQGCPVDKVGVSRLGVRTAQIAAKIREKRSNELRLVQVATLTEKKGHILTLDAFASAIVDCPNMTLTIVGSPKNDQGYSIGAALKARVKEVGLQQKVTFMPVISFERLHGFLGDYHVFIHPSVYGTDLDSEGGAPVVLLDAQATAMPVISTTHCDIPDEVIAGRTGLLAPEHDVEALALHIRRFYEMEQEEYNRFAAAARKHVKHCYDIRQNASVLRKIYDQVSEKYHREAKTRA